MHIIVMDTRGAMETITRDAVTIRKSRLVITARKTDARAKEASGIESDSIVSSGIDSICPDIGNAEGVDHPNRYQ